ncbi:MAG TPA: hypothetical protein VMW76_03995 [Bacteroidales bacterium]|nr:hypothetical protein [Bacteroidales bacterium]
MKKVMQNNLTILIGFFLIIDIAAQEKEDETTNIREGAVKIFIDCQHCDMNYIREEIPYANYVRDVSEAEVYILETSQSTGSGGESYTYTFLGQHRFKGMADTLVYNSSPDDMEDKTREGRTKMLKMGLMRYVAKTPLVSEVEINHSSRLETEEVIDRWNYWVFEIETEPDFEFEESLKEFSLDNAVQAVKITPDWKLEFDFDQSFNRTRYNYEDSTYERDRKSWSQENLIVKSLSDHWSAGAQFSIGSSSFSNHKFKFDFYPSVEYNIYPYSESTHRQFRMLYGLGFSSNNYLDSTIYDKLNENLFEQHLRFAYMIQEKWGEVNISLNSSVYLHDLKKNMIELDGFIRIRIIKGLSVQISGSVGRIHNQLSLVKGDLDEAEILLQLQELATEYRIDGRLGLVYTFGSIYNNIVNPRFGESSEHY